MEKSTAAKDADREQKRMRPLRDIEVENWFPIEERQRQRRAELHVFQREHADRERRQRESKSGADT